MNKNPPIDARLLLAAELCRKGARFADIGTDHAHLPLYLLSIGRISSAVAADVAEGPLARAKRSVEAAGMADRVTLLLADGLSGMEGLGLTDIAICGTGGELIASILAAAPFVRDPSVRLILQPMTRAEALRRYLAEAGFSVVAERYAVSGGRAYLCLGAAYSGNARTVGPIEAVLGDPALRDVRDREAFLAFLDMREKEAKGRLCGKKLGNASASFEEELLSAIKTERENLL